MNDFQIEALLPLPKNPDARTGYRLRRLEVKNFGGYHGPATPFHLDEQGAVFSGENGVGKSTAIDAYRLIYSSTPRFNSATQSASRDRTVETYYTGQYGLKGDGAQAQILKLRGYGNPATFMAICAVFATDHGEVFSALRMAYYPKRGESPQWRNITGHVDLSIERDFAVWDTPGNIRTTAASMGAKLHDSTSDYFMAVAQAFGIETAEEMKEAFRLLDQSIGIKKMDSTTEFAREYIFPRASLAEQASDVVAAWQNNRDMIALVEAAERKITGLEEALKAFATFEKTVATVDATRLRAQRAGQMTSLAMRASLGRTVRSQASRLALNTDRVQTETCNENAARDVVNALTQQMRELGIDQIDELKRRLHAAQQQLETIKARREALAAKFARLGIPFVANTPEELADAAEQLRSKDAQMAREIAEWETKSLEDRDHARDLTRALEEAEQRVRNIQSSRTALPIKLVEARTKLADALGLEEQDLPFIAEMIQVRREDAAEWEGAANRLLGGLGTEILVPAASISKARKAANAGNWGVRLVLQEIAEGACRPEPKLDPRALARKLEIAEKAGYTDTVRALVFSKAGHVCLSAAQFPQAKGDAITAEGAILSNNRVVKDDRRPVGDRSNWILGWDIQDRLQDAMRAAATARQAQEKALAVCTQHAQGLKARREKQQELHQVIGGFPAFAEIDESQCRAAIVSYDAQIKALDTDEARSLSDRLGAARKAEAEARTARDAANSEVARATQTIKLSRQQMAEQEQILLDSIRTCGAATAEDRRRYRAAIVAALGAPKGAHAWSLVARAPYTALSKPLSDAQRSFQDGATKAAGSVSGTGAAAAAAAAKFLLTYTDERTALESEVLPKGEDPGAISRAQIVRAAWKARLDYLRKDDLPQRREKLKESERIAAKSVVGQLNSAVEKYRTKLMTMESGLNAILERLVYDPVEGTRARLRIRPQAQNVAIRDFRVQLQAAARETYVEGSPEVERINTQLTAMVSGTTEADTKLRNMIFDLRQWFELSVEEFLPDADGNFLELRRTYGGSSGSSGGQAERLTMLLVGAAMSYAFGGHDPSRRHAGLQTVVLDEAFMHGSEDTAAAATELLDAMGLQVIAATPASKLQAFAGKAERVFNISKTAEQTKAVASTYLEIEADERRIEKEFERKTEARA